MIINTIYDYFKNINLFDLINTVNNEIIFENTDILNYMYLENSKSKLINSKLKDTLHNNIINQDKLNLVIKSLIFKNKNVWNNYKDIYNNILENSKIFYDKINEKEETETINKDKDLTNNENNVINQDSNVNNEMVKNEDLNTYGFNSTNQVNNNYNILSNNEKINELTNKTNNLIQTKNEKENENKTKTIKEKFINDNYLLMIADKIKSLNINYYDLLFLSIDKELTLYIY